FHSCNRNGSVGRTDPLHLEYTGRSIHIHRHCGWRPHEWYGKCRRMGRRENVSHSEGRHAAGLPRTQRNRMHRMKIAIIGAGVIGSATAWEFLREGHDVMLLEARDGPGLGTSYAN